MKFALLPNLTRKNAREVTLKVCDFFKENNVGYCFEESLRGEFSDSERYLPENELLDFADIIIAIGGDGSIIHAAKKACKYSKAVLGINAGNLAFMAGVENNEIELLKKLINGNYKTDKRMLLDVKIYDRSEKLLFAEDCCVNDIVIARGQMIKMIRLNVSCDGDRINEYYADGIIISTPTGTTAYSLSAGGPVVDPKIKSIVLTPICTHSLFSRSIIFDSDSQLCVKIPDEEKEEICISCDGDESIIIPSGSKIVIEKSKTYANFIRIKNDSFIDVLNSKLAQRRV